MNRIISTSDVRKLSSGMLFAERSQDKLYIGPFTIDRNLTIIADVRGRLQEGFDGVRPNVKPVGNSITFDNGGETIDLPVIYRVIRESGALVPPFKKLKDGTITGSGGSVLNPKTMRGQFPAFSFFAGSAVCEVAVPSKDPNVYEVLMPDLVDDLVHWLRTSCSIVEYIQC